MINVDVFKAMLVEEGLPVSTGDGINSVDIGSYARYVAADQYRSGAPYNLHAAMYGLAYPQMLHPQLASTFMLGEFDQAFINSNGLKPSGKVLHGTGISNTNFLISNSTGIQLALKGFYTGLALPEDVSQNGVFYLKSNHEGKPWVFLYSLATVGDAKISDYLINLSVSTDTETGEGDAIEFVLNDKGEFVGDVDTISDNTVTEQCVQNVQSFNFDFLKKHLTPTPTGDFVTGTFAVTLGAVHKETEEAVALTAIFVVTDAEEPDA